MNFFNPQDNTGAAGGLNLPPQGQRIIYHARPVDIWGALRRTLVGDPDPSTINNQYEDLLKMFPDIDPDFLKLECKARAGNQDSMSNFVTELLEHRQYPKRVGGTSTITFANLIDLFPSVDVNYLRREYIQREGDEVALNLFISEMLENNHTTSCASRSQDVDSLTDRAVFQYQKLLDLFPDAEPNYLWDQCMLRPDDQSIQDFISDATRDNNYPKQKHVLQKNNGPKQEIEQQFQKLLQLFPDADPQYLRNQCELRVGDEEGMKRFIEKASHYRTYPKAVKHADSHEMDLQYQRLLELLPDAEPQYLWEKCKEYINDSEKMGEFIQQTLQNGTHSKNPVPKPSFEGVHESMQEIVGAQYRDLLELFPNADPSFLLDKVKSFGGDEKALQDFITDALENHNYPTMEHHIETQRIAELRRVYFDEFFAGEFINLFPDPWNYFLNEKPGNKEPCPLTTEYLQRRYLELQPRLIDAAYRENRYSLARTCKYLDTRYPKVRESRPDILYGFSEITVPFVQEVAFVEHEAKLEEYLEFRKTVRGRLMKRAREAGTLMECACCYNDELLPDEITTCSSGHLFCIECVRRGSETVVGEGKTIFPCYLGNECTGEFSLITLQTVLKPTVFSSLLLRKQMIEVTEAGVSDIETCPFCDFVTMKAADDIKIFSCRNPQCMKDSCRSCGELSHVPYRCNEMEKPEEVRMRTFIEDRMTQALVRECYKCKRKFIKQDGCNKMVCQCGAMMCYLCRQPVTGYDHFDQGLRRGNRCALWSNNEDLHVAAVMNEGRQARNEVLRDNPDFELKNDPTLVPPK